MTVALSTSCVTHRDKVEFQTLSGGRQAERKPASKRCHYALNEVDILRQLVTRRPPRNMPTRPVVSSSLDDIARTLKERAAPQVQMAMDAVTGAYQCCGEVSLLAPSLTVHHPLLSIALYDLAIEHVYDHRQQVDK